MKKSLFIITLIFSFPFLSYNQTKNSFETTANTKEFKIQKKYLIGDFDPAIDSDFVLIDKKYTPPKKTFYLRKEVYQAFLKLYKAAKKDSIQIKIVSAIRNFDYQKNLWDEKWNNAKIINEGDTSIPDTLTRVTMLMKYLSMPGTSRHHWGTDIDLNSGDPDYYFTDEGDKFYKWMKVNAAKFGFCQPYILKRYNPLSVQEERWHWSYLPLAHKFLEEYIKTVSYEDIKGFNGSEKAITLDVIKNYVLNINAGCY